ncbi:MAG: hypothetical protein C5B54_08265 [Acidobacteria bacterium]|nr:MAG: hypothetical protein C5B54_08265 [Acidobacteriota bacterium]
MIYGATGRSGELIARKAVARGLRPILAGRDAQVLYKLGETLKLPCRVFEFGDWERVRQEISRVNLLVNAAGPLMQTSVLVAESCLAGHTHYFDLTNQVPSLVAIYTLDAEAREKGLTLLPGLALSPAASNCLIKHLHSLLPDADDLHIVVEPFMHEHSPGANLTIAENIVQGGFRRRGGSLERYRIGGELIEADLPSGPRRMLPSALGDVEAAYRCTRLPNITTYIVSEIPTVFGGWQRRARVPAVRSTLVPAHADTQSSVDHGGNGIHGGEHQSMVWARMSQTGKKSLEGLLQFGEGHDFTAAAVVAGVSRLLENRRLSAGAHTPATALGADFVLELPNVKRTIQPLEPENDVRARL